MTVPFLDVTKLLNKCGAKVTYSDVLLIADVFEGKPITPHHVRAVENAQEDQFTFEMINKTVYEEARRRA